MLRLVQKLINKNTKEIAINKKAMCIELRDKDNLIMFFTYECSEPIKNKIYVKNNGQIECYPAKNFTTIN